MTLRLDNNSIVSLEPLAGAGWLSELSVDQNPLQGLQGLEDLELGDLSAEGAGLTHVTDLAPLAGHTWLQEVHATGNDISSLASIAEAPWVLARCAHMDLEGNPLDVNPAAWASTADPGDAEPGAVRDVRAGEPSRRKSRRSSWPA